MNPKAVRRQQEAEYCRIEEDAFYANPTDENRNRVLRKRTEFDWYKIKEHFGVEELQQTIDFETQDPETAKGTKVEHFGVEE